MKKLITKQQNHHQHWVGDGFPVRSIFSYQDLAQKISPFLLMDYAGPAEFKPSQHRRGVGEHPHRGFETVTIVYEGQVEHRDSAGGGGVIGPGDVQWMTAASGLVHEEKHGKDFTRDGGRFEMVQLWVNLPAKDKMAKPRYQGITSNQIPVIELADQAGQVRVIAGDFLNKKGPAKTFTPIQLWDLRLRKDKQVELRIAKDFTTAVFVLSGEVVLHDGEKIGAAEIAILDGSDEVFTLFASQDAKILVLGGEPIQEPIVGYGPFVMNSIEEIRQAFVDFESGRMGQINTIENA